MNLFLREKLYFCKTIMATDKIKANVAHFPEETCADGTKVYGETSMDNCLAVLTHILHSDYEVRHNLNADQIAGIKELVNDWLDAKGENHGDFTNDDIADMVEDPIQTELFKGFFDVPFPAPEHPKFTFIDLFAGIGGFRIAMQNLGGKCVYSSEFDAQAQKTYLANYGEMPFGDITKESTKSYIPEKFDVLCAGFPCQAFSLAGKRLGFKDETRGTLFFEVEDVLRRHQPKAFFLENVKGLAIHDKGRTLKTILDHLDDAGYTVVTPKILNAMDFGVPQHRERIYLVGFRKDLEIKPEDFHYPEPTTPAGKRPKFRDIMEDHEVSVKYYLSTQYIETLKRHKARHVAKGNGFGYEIIDIDGVSNAIVVGGMGRERNLIIDKRLTNFTPITHIKGEVNREGIRRMTPREWARLQGFPDKFRIVVADASAYKQFGNSVAVPAIQATAEQEIKLLHSKGVL
jgi:DNA (cytosine-5)-methyltransferase 1